MSDIERIERLETIVRSLNQQLAELRSEVAALRGAPRSTGVAGERPEPHASPDRVATEGAERYSNRDAKADRPADPAAAPWEARHETPRSAPYAPRTMAGATYGAVASLDFEELIGRYGTIALATLALHAGMGAFLTWAIAHGLLGPVQRVVLGALGAAVVAGIGWWLRARGTVRFGNTLLAIALALFHLDLWAAGPRLHVIPPTAALILIAAASVALASLALRAAEEPLFCVGLGGALIAPFVASTGGGSAVVLASYGWIVIAGAIAAIASRKWRFSIAITGIGCLVYAAAAQGLLRAASPWPERGVPVLFTLACAWAALAWGVSAVRARLALGFLVVGAGALLASRFGDYAAQIAVALGLAGSFIALASPRTGFAPRPWRILAAILLPLAFLGAALAKLAHPDTMDGALVALLWVALAGAAAWSDAEDRELHLITVCATSAIAVFLALNHHGAWCIVALAAHASLFSWLMRERDSAELAIPVAIVLATIALWSYTLLLDRTAYAYTPFATAPSAAALATTLAFWAFSHFARRISTVDLEILANLPAIAAFFWFREELAYAFSYDVSVFLLVVFYALAGIAAIFYGRRHSHAPSRAVGLTLACYAALKALIHAWGLSAIGLRVGACILAGAFIAVVAYWYRGEGAESREQTAGREGTGDRKRETGTASA
jgi:uncharacterized membrane protein